LVTTFSVLALITSLIGFTYGLVDAWTDIFGINQKSEAFGRLRPALYALVYLPPLALSMTDPGIFLTALEYGGAFGVSTLFLVLPPLMVWKERYENTHEPLITKPMVGFGKLPLGAMWLVAGTLILEQTAEKTGVLDAISSAL
jgi:tyrosine-specific transport protein